MLRLLSPCCSFIKRTLPYFTTTCFGRCRSCFLRIFIKSQRAPDDVIVMSSRLRWRSDRTWTDKCVRHPNKKKEKWHQQVWRRKQLRRETLQNQLGEICWIRYSFFLPGNFFLELIRKLLISRQKRLLSNLYPHIKSKGCFTALLTRCQEYNSVGELLNPDGLNPEHLNTVF